MVFGIAGGIGPFRVFIPIGGRYRTSDDPTITYILIGIALVAGGAWGTVEGLQGRWGVTGRVFGIIFIIGTVLSLASRSAGTGFLTSWLYLVLARVGYFELTLWPGNLFDRYSDWQSLDELVLFALSGVLYLANLALVLLGPPLVVFVLLTWLHAATGVLEMERDGSDASLAQGILTAEPSMWQQLKSSFLEGWREADGPPDGRDVQER